MTMGSFGSFLFLGKFFNGAVEASNNEFVTFNCFF